MVAFPSMQARQEYALYFLPVYTDNAVRETVIDNMVDIVIALFRLVDHTAFDRLRFQYLSRKAGVRNCWFEKGFLP